MNETLTSILNNLLLSRVKADDAPCASDQHWCTAIEMLSKLIPDYQPTDAEQMYEFKQAMLNQEVLHGRLKADEALAILEPYEVAALNDSWTLGAFLWRREREKADIAKE